MPRVTRSKAAGFEVLNHLEEEFPELAESVKGPAVIAEKIAGPAAKCGSATWPAGTEHAKCVSATRQTVSGHNSGKNFTTTGGQKAGEHAANTADMDDTHGNEKTPTTSKALVPVTKAPTAINSPAAGKGDAAKQAPAVENLTKDDSVKTVAVTIDNEQAAQAKPWNALFKDNRDPKHGIKLKYVPPKGETLDFGDRVLPSMVEMWGFCLVGHFTGNFPGLKAVHDLKATWGVRCFVRSHNKGWVIFKFTNEEDRLKVLHDGPYNVFGKLLMLKELLDDFSFEDEEFLKVPIWVKFPKLPMKLWNDEAMSEVASMIGVPITTDKITQERANNEYARVLIEVDVSKPPPLSFPIRLPSKKVIKQSVLYETFPNYCFHCKEFGHHPFICKKLVKRVDGASEKEPRVETNKDIESVATQTDVAAQGNQTGHTSGPTGPLVKTAPAVERAAYTPEHTKLTGSVGQRAKETYANVEKDAAKVKTAAKKVENTPAYVETAAAKGKNAENTPANVETAAAKSQPAAHEIKTVSTGQIDAQQPAKLSAMVVNKDVTTPAAKGANPTAQGPSQSAQGHPNRLQGQTAQGIEVAAA